MAERYNIRETEEKWRKKWEDENVFHVTEDPSKKKYYVLEMFPYPSGRIHMGHVRNYSLGDVVARYRTAQGYNVLHPMGWDAFGLPAENAALERGAHPKDWTLENIVAMKVQLKQMGLSIDWDREVTTCLPDYYKHEQKMFLDFLKEGLAYRKEMMVNWDPVDHTVLANEQVIDGKGWRTGAPVERKKLNQWSLKITDYAEELLEAIKTLDRWPEKVRIMQENWIGKSQGCRFTFNVIEKADMSQAEAIGNSLASELVTQGIMKPLNSATGNNIGNNKEIEKQVNSVANLENWDEESEESVESKDCSATSSAIDSTETLDVFTTRPDTLYGASFAAMAADHPLAHKLCAGKDGFEEFVKKCQAMGTSEAAIEQAEKIGFNTGHFVDHPFIEGKKLPLYLANFILMDYGTGAIFGCPAHDQRDFDFATKYGLEITQVVAPKDGSSVDLPYTDDGIMVNSDFMNGMSTTDSKAAAIRKMEDIGRGTGVTQYRLRDWGISRQRYWGCPIPIIYCDDCGTVPVPENQLPVELPQDVTFDKPGNPLAHHPTWKKVKCPTCGKDAERETDTFDTFFESSWYFARYADPKNDGIGFAKDKAAYWLPVDQYIGGVEHAVLHLLYSRFFTRALSKCGYMDTPEPFAGLYTQGMINHMTYKDKDGKWVYPKDVMKDENGNWVMTTGNHEPVVAGRVEKMSKSKRNTIDPQDILDSYGADAARMFILSDSPPDRDLEWTEAGLGGSWRFINRLHSFIMDAKNTILTAPQGAPSDAALQLQKMAHQTIHAVGQAIEAFHMNKAVAKLRELYNAIESFKAEAGDTGLYKEAVEYLIRGLNPMAPHLTEELWSELGHKEMLVRTAWPTVNPEFLVADSVTIAIQINGKLKATIQLPTDTAKEEAEKAALSEESVANALEGKTIRKVIVVPNRIVNVVAG